MNVTPARIAEARAIAAELDIPADAVDDNSGLTDLIAAARNVAHLRTLLRSEAVEAGILADHDADQDDEDADTDDAATGDAADVDYHETLEYLAPDGEYREGPIAGPDDEAKDAKKEAARARRAAKKAAAEPRPAPKTHTGKNVDSDALPAGTVRARAHGKGDQAALVANVKVDGGYEARCLTHGATLAAKTRRQAHLAIMAPATFCPTCATLVTA